METKKPNVLTGDEGDVVVETEEVKSKGSGRRDSRMKDESKARTRRHKRKRPCVSLPITVVVPVVAFVTGIVLSKMYLVAFGIASIPWLIGPRRRKQSGESPSSRAQKREDQQPLGVFLLLLLPTLVPFALMLGFNFQQSKRSKGFRALTLRLFINSFCVWLFHQLSFRHDPIGAKFFESLPGSNRFVLGLIRRAVQAAKRWSKFQLEYKVLPASRGRLQLAMSELAFFDDAMLTCEMEQVIVLGGAMTSFAFCEKLLENQGIRVFEVNDKRFQNMKKRCLRSVFPNGVPSNVTLLTSRKPLNCNFGWTEQLQEAGFQREKPTLILVADQIQAWQPEFVEAFMDDVAEIFGKNKDSRMVFSYVDESKVVSRSRVSIYFSSAKWKFGIPDDEQEEWISRFGPVDVIRHERIEALQLGFILCGGKE